MSDFVRNEVGRNRIAVGSIAVIVIILGMLLLGIMPTGTVPNAGKTAQTEAATPERGSEVQGEEFKVRDYSEFTGSSAADIPSSDWFGLLAGMILKLGLVVALIFLVAMALRRYVYRASPVTANRKKPISLLGSLNLAPNKTVYVLEVGRKVLVVGGTQSQLSLLTEVTDPEAIEEVRSQFAEPSLEGQFAKLFHIASQQLGEQKGISSPDNQVGESLQRRFQDGRSYVQNRLAQMRQSLGQN